MRFSIASSFFSGLLLGLLVLPTARAGDICGYEFEEVNVPDDSGDDLSTSWFSINDSGQVVGNYCIDPDCLTVDDQIMGGVIHDTKHGTFEVFTLPLPYNWVGGVSITDSGVVVGQAIESTTDGDVMGTFVATAAFIRDTDGTITILDAPVDGATHWGASAMDPRGTVIGWYRGPGLGYHGYLYNDGEYEVYDAAEVGLTQPNDMNARGDIVGLIRQSGKFVTFIADRGAHGGTDIDVIDIEDGSGTYGRSINDKGAVAGDYLPEDSTVDPDYGPSRSGFFYNDGEFVTFDHPGATDTRAMGINNSGTVVGTIDYFTWGIIGEPVACDE